MPIAPPAAGAARQVKLSELLTTHRGIACRAQLAARRASGRSYSLFTVVVVRTHRQIRAMADSAEPADAPIGKIQVHLNLGASKKTWSIVRRYLSPHRTSPERLL